MGKIIEYVLDQDRLFKYAKAAFNKGDYLLCVQNINEGLQYASKDSYVRNRFYRLLISVYENTDNIAAKMDIMVKNAPKVAVEFAKIDFKEVTPVEYCYGYEFDDEEDFSEVYDYNSIRDLLIKRQYTKAFSEMMTVVLSQKYLIKITEYICIAYDEDKSFNLNDYFVPTISLLARLDDKSKLIGVMLASEGACRDIVKDGALMFGDDADDLVKLLTLAEVYFSYGEIQIAKHLYQNALSYSPYNEDALFHLTAILYREGNKEKADKVFAKYKVMFQSTFLPVSMYQRYFASEYAFTPMLYPFLDTSFADDVAMEILDDLNLDKAELSTAKINEIGDAISICQKYEDCLLAILLGRTLNKDNFIKLSLELLPRPSINDNIKEKMISNLYEIGYQGPYVAFHRSKLVKTNMVQYANYNTMPNVDFFTRLYYKLVLELPFNAYNIPLKCNVLKNTILKVKELVGKDFYEEYENCIEFLVLKNYAKDCKIIVDWDNVQSLLKIDEIMVASFFVDFELNDWILK